MHDEPPPIPINPRSFVTADEFRDAERALKRTSQKRTPPMMPFTILVDTREQTPLTFPPNVPTCRVGLSTGDYSIAGCSREFTVERKSLADAIHTVIHDRDRFVRELERMQTFAFRRVIITAPFARVLRGQYRHSNANPNSVIGLWRSLEVKYDVPITFADDGEQAARHIVDWAKYFVRQRALRSASGIPGAPTPPPPGLGTVSNPMTRDPSGGSAALEPIPPINTKECQL